MATCIVCEQRFGYIELTRGVCRQCRDKEERAAKAQVSTDFRRMIASGTIKDWAEVPSDIIDEVGADIIVTTTYSVPDRRVEEIISIVTAEVALGMHIFKDIANSFRDVFGGRSATMQSSLRQARENCITELKREALRLSADAILAVDLDYSEFTSPSVQGGMLFVVASGTAVRLAPPGQ